MLHGFDLPTTDPPGRLGGPTKLVGQPKRRPQRGVAGDPAVLRLRHPETRPKRPNVEVGGAKPSAAPQLGRPSLSALPAAVREVARLRAVRNDLRTHGSRRAPPSRRPARGRATGRPDESERQARI